MCFETVLDVKLKLRWKQLLIFLYSYCVGTGVRFSGSDAGLFSYYVKL